MLSHPNAATGRSATRKTPVFCLADPALERRPRRFENHLPSARSRMNSPPAMCAIAEQCPVSRDGDGQNLDRSHYLRAARWPALHHQVGFEEDI